MSGPLLDVSDLVVEFRTERGVARAVDGVSFSLAAGQTLGLVGESGSGKSVTCGAILGLLPGHSARVTRGAVRFDGQDLLTLPERARRRLRGSEISMIFQDPMSSLNPYLRVGQQLTEVVRQHERVTAAEARSRAVDMLAQVGIPDPDRRFDQHPHAFSGGMRQRVMIAMALLCRPRLLIADEPTTALDVTVQAQILELITALRREAGTSVILVTHDLGVVAGAADAAVVLYGGQVMEAAPVDALFARPAHPYTRGLMDCLPRLDAPAGEPLRTIAGLPPGGGEPVPGCPFAPRCPAATAQCRDEAPPARSFGPGHLARCHHPLIAPAPEPSA